MLKICDIKIKTDDKRSLDAIAANVLGIECSDITKVKIFRKSLDARKKHDVHYVYTLLVCARNEKQILSKKTKNVSLYKENKYNFDYQNISSQTRPVIVGLGPAGLFCALMLSKAGLKPIVVERGESVEDRTLSVKKFLKDKKLNPNSNIQFGEGGAGTFSDGKLTCGKNDIRTDFVLSQLVEAGAPEQILYDAKPHVGTDYLKKVIPNIRNQIIANGGEVRFNTCLTDFETCDGKITKIVLEDTKTSEKEEIPCSLLVLSIGHSSRDTYEMLKRKGMSMEKKPFSVGVRIEHKREYINLLQYKDIELAETLPAADYKLSCHPGGRGVYTFCMCPGGEVVCSSSEDGGVVTNGMSYYARDLENSNSALLVSVYPDDTGGDLFGGMYLQRDLEQKAFALGGGDYFAPCQRVEDFMNKRPTKDLGEVKPSYLPGVRYANLWDILPDFVAKGLYDALKELDLKMYGFMLGDALLTGVETRSSAPVRLIRDENMLSSIGGIYPIGEGAGYAGGIMSSAIDGIKCAEKIIQGVLWRTP